MKIELNLINFFYTKVLSGAFFGFKMIMSPYVRKRTEFIQWLKISNLIIINHKSIRKTNLYNQFKNKADRIFIQGIRVRLPITIRRLIIATS